MIAFDADVLIYAAAPGHPLGARVTALLEASDLERVGSVLLVPEVLTKPLREDPDGEELRTLTGVLARLDLRPLDGATARLAAVLGVQHGLRAADATHLATAVASGADHFLTNNRRDFSRTIPEIDVVHPGDLDPLG